MIYNIVKWIVKLTLNSYFRRITIKGKDLVPAQGPVILFANHPSAFMDPMVIAAYIKRPIHFITAGEFMSRGLGDWIYRTQFNMIPVYRQETMPGDTRKNTEMFSKCFELLASGGVILIFPEGVSITENRLRKLKTGVARMAIGARNFSGGKIDVAVVPVGLNYSNPHRFQSDLFVNIGEPVATGAYSMKKADVVQLTSDLEQRLKKTVLHIQDEGLDSVVEKVQLVLKHQLNKDHALTNETEQEFQLQQHIIASVHDVHAREPGAMVQIERKLDDYLNKIRELEISDQAVASPSAILTSIEILKLIAGLPLFIAGFVINVLPYYGAVLIPHSLNLVQQEGAPVSKKKLRPSFRGSIWLATGMVLFLLWYPAWALFSIWMTGTWWVAVPALVFFYLSGLFTLHYINWTVTALQKRKRKLLLNTKIDLFASLLAEREEIIHALKKITPDIEIKLRKH